jgi:hypothetical protein
MDGSRSSDGKGRGVYRILVGKAEGKRPLGKQGVDGRIILRWIVRKWDVGVWTGSRWLGIVQEIYFFFLQYSTAPVELGLMIV